jgi:hypothetical protein
MKLYTILNMTMRKLEGVDSILGGKSLIVKDVLEQLLSKMLNG